MSGSRDIGADLARIGDEFRAELAAAAARRADPSLRSVVCLGDVMIDLVAQLRGPLVTGSDSPATITMRGGGAAGNTACWLAHQRVPTTLIGSVGSDEFGDWLESSFDEPDLDVRLARGRRPTGTCLVLVGPDGERTMVPDAGANADLRPRDLDDDVFNQGDHLHISGYSLLGGSRAAALLALDQARDSDMTVSVDAASSAPLKEMGPAAFLELVGLDLLLFANLDEARVLTGESNPRSCAQALAAAVDGQAVVKCGKFGAVWSDGAAVVRAPTEPLDPLDTTGAGDAFAAGLLSALGTGAGVSVALQQANALAGRACLIVGGRPT